MAHGGTFVRPGALAWGRPDRAQGPDDVVHAHDCVAVEDALAAAVKHPDLVTELIDALRLGRLWLPLPEDDGPVTDGSAVQLPTVTYLGAEFVPAFTSPEQLAAWPLGGLVPVQHTPDQVPAMPHIVVPAAELARLLPPGVGIALNPGGQASVPIYPEGVGYLAAAATGEVRIGHPPDDPVALLSEVRTNLRSVAAVRHASRAWLSVPGAGEGLVLSVALRDPANEASHHAVIEAIELAAAAVPHQFPIDVTFPGEGAPDQLDEWITAYAEPFYVGTVRLL
jgi:hypothetical protein